MTKKISFGAFIAQDADPETRTWAITYFTPQDNQSQSPRRTGVYGRKAAEKKVAELKAQGMLKVTLES